MTTAAVRPRTAGIPLARTATDDGPAPRAAAVSRAVGYQRVLHQLIRRELRLLSELATWAPPDEAGRTTTLTQHADLIGRVLLHHHAVERDAVWPALFRAVPSEWAGEVGAALDDWTDRCARIDHMLRDVLTAARQWGISATARARDTFATACRTLADAVDRQTRAEEGMLLPLVDEYLEPEDWTAIARSSHCRLTPREQLLVLGLALEDASAADRVRLLQGLPRATRAAWRLSGGRHYRAAVVRLRGEPPAV
jgi:hypothetical protein